MFAEKSRDDVAIVSMRSLPWFFFAPAKRLSINAPLLSGVRTSGSCEEIVAAGLSRHRGSENAGDMAG
jgi:hypothetical protein